MVLPNMGYKPPDRVWFLRVRILKSGNIFDHLGSYMRGHRGFYWKYNPTQGCNFPAGS